MPGQVIFRNDLGSPLYVTLFYECPLPNRFSSLAMMAYKAEANMTVEFQLQQNPYAFTWAKYNQKHKGIFTTDNQVECYPRSNNVITFSNDKGPGFKDQTGAPVDELDIKIDKNVRSNSYYGGLCLGNKPIYAQLMQPGDTQRYPTQMNLVFGYSLQPIETGQIIAPTAIKQVSLREYQSFGQVFIELDRNGNINISTQVSAGVEADKA